jgi:hypothetical protein
MRRIDIVAYNIFVLVVIALFLSTALIVKALAQHPPEHQELHEKFYSTWLRPDWGRVDGRRTESCCNEQDCYPVETRMRNGKWEYLRREDNAWIIVRDGINEMDQDDPRESPDGRSHVCATTAWTYCFVPGAGI